MGKKAKLNTIKVQLDDATSLALAQFCKRVGWQEISANAIDETETYLICSGMYALQRALADTGFAPQ